MLDLWCISGKQERWNKRTFPETNDVPSLKIKTQQKLPLKFYNKCMYDKIYKHKFMLIVNIIYIFPR